MSSYVEVYVQLLLVFCSEVYCLVEVRLVELLVGFYVVVVGVL